MNFTKINELKPYDLNCNIFDVYSYNGLSMQELLCQFFTKINECIKTSNETIDLAEWLVNEGLKQEVATKLTNWLNDGTLENLINVTLFENLNKKIDDVSSQLEHIANKKTYVKSNGSDDTTSIQNALNKKGIVILNDDNYYITDTLYISSDTILEGVGVINCNVSNDCLSVNTSASNIKIKGITIKNATRFGIQIYGQEVVSKPHDITIENIKTINCGQGGMFLNSCYNVTVRNCFNDGGVRAIGTFAPIDNPLVTHNIVIDRCDSINTIGFGHQTYYGKNITINNCNIDGTLTNSQDRSCITVDRSKEVVVSNNILKNATSSNIFVTGCEGVTVNNNVTFGGVYGIQCIYNLESQEDAEIKENKNTVISNNIVKNASNTGIILNSCLKHTIISNSISDCEKGIYIMQQVRERDDVQMISDSINIVSNITDNDIELTSIDGSCDFLYNIYRSIKGLSSKNKVIDNKTIRLSNTNLEEVGFIKKTNASHTSWLLENRYSDESYHKGWNMHNNYGSLVFSDSDGNSAFSINISDGNNKKDIQTIKAGAGLIVTSPDGNITKRIGISNGGEIVLTTV